ncbi:conserved protein of unknown function (plasmid) [Rhodovastum atsumiense]|uniref:Uncharacterized protein n=1 Tax=Rhodovastum atsumiense TaxID=504468 RepID=A0A5M6IV58_9PROT|nr:hypothetical protein [Rhodovastum atsumiense]KAA5611829.1 hypothetical protein F1189_12390 [Rhodovastum atsumiense]CAH2606059.1 conserved protein of unknown function [Rhodovastum atsumiense]
MNRTDSHAVAHDGAWHAEAYQFAAGGMRRREIATRFGVSPAAVSLGIKVYITKSGLASPFRPTGGSSAPRPSRRTFDRKAAYEMLMGGMGQKRAAKALGVRHSTLRAATVRWCAEQGLPMPPAVRPFPRRTRAPVDPEAAYRLLTGGTSQRAAAQQLGVDRTSLRQAVRRWCAAHGRPLPAPMRPAAARTAVPATAKPPARRKDAATSTKATKAEGRAAARRRAVLPLPTPPAMPAAQATARPPAGRKAAPVAVTPPKAELAAPAASPRTSTKAARGERAVTRGDSRRRPRKSPCDRAPLGGPQGRRASRHAAVRLGVEQPAVLELLAAYRPVAAGMERRQRPDQLLFRGQTIQLANQIPAIYRGAIPA